MDAPHPRCPAFLSKARRPSDGAFGDTESPKCTHILRSIIALVVLLPTLNPAIASARQDRTAGTKIEGIDPASDTGSHSTETYFHTDLSDKDRQLYETMRTLAEAMRDETSERTQAAALAYLLTAMDRPRMPDPEVIREFVDLSATAHDGPALQWVATVCGILSPEPAWCESWLLDETAIRFDGANLLTRAWVAESDALLGSLEQEPKIAWYHAELTQVWFNALQSVGEISGLESPGERMQFAFEFARTQSHPRLSRFYDLCEGRVILDSIVNEPVLRQCERLSDRLINEHRSIEEWRLGHRLSDMIGNVRMFGDTRERPNAFGRLPPVEQEVARYRCRERWVRRRMPDWTSAAVKLWLDKLIEVGPLEAVNRAAERMDIDCENPWSEANTEDHITTRSSSSEISP
ncbi:hypothetical protein [Halomonas denitrificans]|nr:hypothetical protein [Halomonas denitrificans]